MNMKIEKEKWKEESSLTAAALWSFVNDEIIYWYAKFLMKFSHTHKIDKYEKFKFIFVHFTITFFFSFFEILIKSSIGFVGRQYTYTHG